MWGGILFFCAVLVGTGKAHGCNLPQSKILCHPPQGAAMPCLRIYTRNTVALLAAWFSSSSLCCVQAQVTQKSDNSTESQPLLNYYIRMVQRMGERGKMWAQISLCCNSCSTGEFLLPCSKKYINSSSNNTCLCSTGFCLNLFPNFADSVKCQGKLQGRDPPM